MEAMSYCQLSQIQLHYIMVEEWLQYSLLGENHGDFLLFNKKNLDTQNNPGPE